MDGADEALYSERGEAFAFACKGLCRGAERALGSRCE